MKKINQIKKDHLALAVVLAIMIIFASYTWIFVIGMSFSYPAGFNIHLSEDTNPSALRENFTSLGMSTWDTGSPNSDEFGFNFDSSLYNNTATPISFSGVAYIETNETINIKAKVIFEDGINPESEEQAELMMPHIEDARDYLQAEIINMGIIVLSTETWIELND